MNDALDQVRKQEYARLDGEKRKYIKSQKYTLLTKHDNLNLEGKAALKKLLDANKRLNTAYLLKENFAQMWNYKSEARGPENSSTTGKPRSNGNASNHSKNSQK